MMLFTDWLTLELEQRGWKHSELARRAGVTRGALSHIFSHTRQPGVELLKKIARALGLSTEEVLRAAGVLAQEPDPEAAPGLGEWIRIFREADDLKRDEMLQSARALAGREAGRTNA